MSSGVIELDRSSPGATPNSAWKASVSAVWAVSE